MGWSTIEQRREYFRDRMREYMRTYNQSEERREERRLATKQWKLENPHKDAAMAARRHASKKNRTPLWTNFKKIEIFYEEAARLTKETGIPHHVDHIIPLQGEMVSGLHVESNLQIITADANLKKGNSFEL